MLLTSRQPNQKFPFLLLPLKSPGVLATLAPSGNAGLGSAADGRLLSAAARRWRPVYLSAGAETSAANLHKPARVFHLRSRSRCARGVRVSATRADCVLLRSRKSPHSRRGRTSQNGGLGGDGERAVSRRLGHRNCDEGDTLWASWKWVLAFSPLGGHFYCPEIMRAHAHRHRSTPGHGGLRGARVR